MFNLSNQQSEWRKRESLELGKRVQDKIKRLQNPSNCEQSKKIYCDLALNCGFGCQIHHLTFCMITAWHTNRTLILNSNSWKYNPRGFEAYFKPISETCKSTNDKLINWASKLIN